MIFCLSEVLFSPFTLEQLEKISEKLEYLREIIRKKDEHKMRQFINMLGKIFTNNQLTVLNNIFQCFGTAQILCFMKT